MKKLALILLASATIGLGHAQEPAKPAAPAVPAAPAAEPAKPAAIPANATKLMLGVIPAVMQFDKKELTVKAGQPVALLFVNAKDPLMHNFILANPGKLNEIGALADKMLTDPTALAKHYTPTSPDILAHGSKLIGLGQSDLIQFTAPTTPGDYPYLCTFPGHWRLMNGVLKVTP